MNTPHTHLEYEETREQFEERVIQSVMMHAERTYYLPETEMPYHNTEHMRFVHDKAVEYGSYVRQHGQEPDMFVLRLAAVMHDANFHEDLGAINAQYKSRGIIDDLFESKEAYSAWTADTLLQTYGIERETIDKVKSCIMATNHQIDPLTLEEKMLVRADLDNITGPKSTFLMNTLKLVKEAELMNGPKNPFERIAFSCSILQDYLNKDLCFGGFDEDIYYRTFKKPALANIARITEQNVRTTVQLLGQRALSVLPSIGRDN